MSTGDKTNDHSVESVIQDVIASDALGKSTRQIRLLTYLIEKTMAGESAKISQYSIAMDVMDRPTSFDSTTDSIVRVEMHRLRANLKTYNAQSEIYAIDLPPARYRVNIKRKAAPASKNKLFSRHSISVYALSCLLFFTGGFAVHAIFSSPNMQNHSNQCSEIMPNISVTHSGEQTDMQQLADRLIRATLSQNTNLNLLQENAVCQVKTAPVFTVDYMVIEHPEDYSVTLTVYANDTQDIIAYEQISGQPQTFDTESTLALNITRTVNEIAKPYGVLARTAVTRKWSKDKARDNYQCLIDMYDSFTTKTDKDYRDTHLCLKKAVESEIAFPDLSGALAASYIEQARGYREQTDGDPYVEAQNVLEAVGENWVNSAELAIAKMSFELRRDDYSLERLRDILAISEAKFSSNPQVLITTSIYTGYNLGDWTTAKHLSDTVKLIHTERDNSVFLLDAGYALVHSPSSDIMANCEKIYTPNSVLANIIVNACAKTVENDEWKLRTDDNLTRLNIATTETRTEFIKNLKFDRNLERSLITAIRKNAG